MEEVFREREGGEEGEGGEVEFADGWGCFIGEEEGVVSGVESDAFEVGALEGDGWGDGEEVGLSEAGGGVDGEGDAVDVSVGVVCGIVGMIAGVGDGAESGGEVGWGDGLEVSDGGGGGEGGDGEEECVECGEGDTNAHGIYGMLVGQNGRKPWRMICEKDYCSSFECVGVCWVWGA